MSRLSKGILITFEGGEGAGKTTLIEGISKALMGEGFALLKTREPGGTPLGEKVRDILLHQSHVTPYAELCLFLASRAQHIAEVIGPAMMQNKIVLCDRFNDSSIVYQGAARGLGMQKVESFCEFVCQGLEPNLTFYLDIDPTIGLSRAKSAREQDRIEAEKIAFHEKIREAYHLLHKEHPHRLVLLDATKTPEQVLSDAMQRIHTMMTHV